MGRAEQVVCDDGEARPPDNDGRAFRLEEPNSIERLQVIYKIAERCNINCTYCYYFNMGEETALARPPLASEDVTERLAHWIAQGCQELGIPHAQIAFHGGEPTLIGVERFRDACRLLRDIIEPMAKVDLAVQTNGTLINDRWIETFIDEGVSVGVSIDGPRAAHDRHRRDRRGRSSFAKTELAIRQLVDAHARGGPRPATISVMDSDNDYRAVYAYLRSLGVQEMRFLLPDRDANDVDFVSSGAAKRFGECLADLIHAWLSEDNPQVHIDFVERLLHHFRPNVVPGQAIRQPRKSNQVVIARTDRTVAIDDTFIPALDWYRNTPVYSIDNATLRDFLSDPIFDEIEGVTRSLPAGCADCRWRHACRGGDLENRFSAQNGFDNPSVYCDAYKVVYEYVCGELVRNGYPAELIASKFEETASSSSR